MKELQNKPQLVRGLIYDDPSLVNETAFITANAASCMVDQKELMEEYLDKCRSENPDDNTIPTADEMNAYSVMLSMISPAQGMRNFIIPTNMVDDNLYNELKKIDIGPKILSEFDYIRLDNCKEEAKEEKDSKVYIHLKNQDGSVKTLEFKDPDEASEFLGYLIDNFNAKKKLYWIYRAIRLY